MHLGNLPTKEIFNLVSQYVWKVRAFLVSLLLAKLSVHAKAAELPIFLALFPVPPPPPKPTHPHSACQSHARQLAILPLKSPSAPKLPENQPGSTTAHAA